LPYTLFPLHSLLLQSSAAGLRGTTRSAAGNIELGDIIIALDKDEIGSESDLFKALEKHQVGDTITLKVLRSSTVPITPGDARKLESVDIKVTLSAPSA
jgi:S1-C subfamily serine protease